ncbi:MAG: DNA-3-methyladenine glycosylase 2 family protein [Actinomycetota bacterium]|nr:DNA-3-methyladenine glycosylase 2 family protein [Actinomycetota bacterium]
MAPKLELAIQGPFSLQAAAEFGFGPHRGGFDGVLRLAFGVDGGQGYAGAVLRQSRPDGPVSVELELRDGASADTALAQVSRIVSLDHDGRAFARVGDADPVLGMLQRAHPGQRPVLFGSPYEAAAWAVISTRRPAAQAARVREELSLQLGQSFELAGRPVQAFPAPRHLLELADQFPGLALQKLIRLRDLAGAATGGELEVAHVQRIGPERAYERLQELPGIGPFYAALIVLRASGFADALLPVAEPRVLAHTARFYGLAEPPSVAAFAALAESWRPFRTWAMVLLRVAGDRGTEVPAVRS